MDMTDPNGPLSEHVKTKTEAPTSGVTQDAETIAKAQRGKLTEDELDFVTLMNQHWNIHGMFPTAEAAYNHYAMTTAEYDKHMASPPVGIALKERGINITPVDPDGVAKWKLMSLSARQLVVADVMLDMMDNRSWKKKLQDLGVSTKEWNAWLKQAAFVKYLDDNTQSVLKNGQHEAALALMDRIQAGDLKAIQFYYEYTGRFVKQSEKSAGTVQADQFDARKLVQGLVEIIVDEVDDFATAQRISDRMKKMITVGAVTDALMSSSSTNGLPEIVKPEIAENRELSEKMIKGMATGVGMDT